jgi:uncharacterized membrane-anchored protein
VKRLRNGRVRAIKTDGDFAHAGRNSAKLSCCTTTTCLVFVGFVGGGLIGLITGFVTAYKAASVAQNGWFVTIIMVLGSVFLWMTIFALLGAAVGLGLDRLGLF